MDAVNYVPFGISDAPAVWWPLKILDVLQFIDLLSRWVLVFRCFPFSLKRFFFLSIEQILKLSLI